MQQFLLLKATVLFQVCLNFKSENKKITLTRPPAIRWHIVEFDSLLNNFPSNHASTVYLLMSFFYTNRNHSSRIILLHWSSNYNYYQTLSDGFYFRWLMTFVHTFTAQSHLLWGENCHRKTLSLGPMMLHFCCIFVAFQVCLFQMLWLPKSARFSEHIQKLMCLVLEFSL